jgi:MFS family permease
MNLSVGEFSSARLARPIAVEHRVITEKTAGAFMASVGVYGLFASLLQILAGAWTGEFSGYPDEAAHFTTGLMLRDYIAQGLPGNPIRYAENYYLHYPKVAIGHWPPLFHLIEAVWLLIFPVSRISVMVLMALYCAVVAALIARWVAPQYGKAAGWATGALFVALPIVQEQTSMVMAEGLLAILAFLAASAYSRYLAEGGWRPALTFSVFSALAILTKGNGWALLMLPFFALLLTRRFRLFLQLDFWAPLAVILALCAPWQLVTARLVQHGWTGKPGPAYFLSAVIYFARELWFGLNPVILLLVLCGAGAAFLARGGAKPRPAAMGALVAAFYMFHGLTPVGLEFRQLMPAIPALLTFVPGGAMLIAKLLRGKGFLVLGRPAAIAAMAGIFFVGETFGITRVQSYGFEQAERFLSTRVDLKNAVVVVSSEAEGEGIAIVEAQIAEPRLGDYMLRANKLLARVDWSGEHYRPAFSSAAAVRNELNLLPASVLILDFTRGLRTREDHKQLLEMIAARPPEWRLAGAFGPDGGDVRPIRIYVRGGPHPPTNEHLRATLADELHRIGEQ